MSSLRQRRASARAGARTRAAARLGVLAAGLLAAAALLEGCGRRASAAERESAPTQDGGRRTLVHDGIRRAYLVRAPRRAADDTARLPVVLVLHGGGGNAENAERTTGFTPIARREGFLVVYPEGTGRLRTTLLTWNAGHCCGRAMERRVDDVGFIAALLDTLARAYPVDPARIYATGMSNGAMMSHRLAMMLPGRLAAIGPVVGALFGDEPPPRGPVSLIAVNGLLDRAVPWAGGAPGGRFSESWDGTPAAPGLAQGAYWARANGCEATPTMTESGAVRTYRHRCPEGRGVELHLVTDNAHAWPGGVPGTRRSDPPSTAFQASEAIWSFFKAHPRRD